MSASQSAESGPVTPVGPEPSGDQRPQPGGIAPLLDRDARLQAGRRSAAAPERPVTPKMRFYSGDHGGGRMNHHDIALVENTALPEPPKDWSMYGGARLRGEPHRDRAAGPRGVAAPARLPAAQRASNSTAAPSMA